MSKGARRPKEFIVLILIPSVGAGELTPRLTSHSPASTPSRRPRLRYPSSDHVRPLAVLRNRFRTRFLIWFLNLDPASEWESGSSLINVPKAEIYYDQRSFMKYILYVKYIFSHISCFWENYEFLREITLFLVNLLYQPSFCAKIHHFS